MSLVYIAGQWKDRQRIKSFAKELKKKGHTITAEWYNDKNIDANSIEEWLKKPEVKKRFIRDLHACDDALYFILYLGDGQNLYGCLVELGIAYTLDYSDRRKRFIAIGKPIKSVFMQKIDVWYKSFNDMLKNEGWINELGEEDEKSNEKP